MLKEIVNIAIIGKLDDETKLAAAGAGTVFIEIVGFGFTVGFCNALMTFVS